jgi:AcrR family transcriptional regulator
MTDTPARRRTASAEVSAALLNAAEAVLDREGSGGITIRAVAREAAVAPMSVYNRFDHKDGLLTALATRTLDELAEAIQTPEDSDAGERFRQACRAYRDFALRHPARYALIFDSGTPLSDQTSAVAERGRAVFGVLADLIRGLTAQASTPPDPTEAAQSVWGAIHGAVSIEQVGIGQTEDATASFENLLTLLITGLSSSGSAP